MNWNRIIANGGLVFFTTLGATSFTGNWDLWGIAVINAVIIAGIAAFTEMQNECTNKPRTTVQKVQSVLSKSLLV